LKSCDYYQNSASPPLISDLIYLADFGYPV
jgi:hypothetical protein